MATDYHDDTIAAIATPVGEGAIAVIRVSGGSAITAVDRIFCGTVKLADAKGNTIHFGTILGSDGTLIDEALASVFHKPYSYTGEDAIEVSCHGGLLVTRKVFEAILSSGVRQAEPGEFTKRAFLNGKMDLSQAEAVADLIAARSESAHRASMNQLEGKFSGSVRDLRTELMNLASLLEVELDFSEEGLSLISKTELLTRTQSLKSRIQDMIDSYRMGRVWNEGVSVAIIGKPNVGKSSIFNRLLKENRAIVTDIPGTTRDTLEESIAINGVLFRMTDTAGLRNTDDPIEVEGVSRSRKAMNMSDVVLAVVDLTQDEGDKSVVFPALGPENSIVVYNKADLVGGTLAKPKMNPEGIGYGFEEVTISAKTGYGIEELRGKLYSKALGGKAEPNGVCVTNGRHMAALERASGMLKEAEKGIQSGASGEFLSLDVRSAADSLAEIVGEITSEDMLNNIFKHFCIGK